MPETNTNAIPVTGEGQIKFILIPEGFVEQRQPVSQWYNSPHIKSFYLEENPDVRIVFYFRGHQIDENEDKHFVNILNQLPHQLEQNELDGLETILYENCSPDDVKIVAAATDNVNSKMVLKFEGIFIEAENYDMGIYISANAKTHLVQELHFLAPEGSQSSYEYLFEKVLQSIEWKTPTQ